MSTVHTEPLWPDADEAAQELRPRFVDLLRAEWTKLRTVRSTYWSLAALVIISVALASVATAVISGQWNTMGEADRTRLLADPVGLIFQPAASFAQIAVCVVGVMAMGSEYSSGMMRTTLLAVPRRYPVVAAKVVVVAALIFIVAELVAIPSFLLGRMLLRERVSVGFDDIDQVRAIVGFGLYLTAIGLFALALGTIIRHVVGSITATVGVVIMLPNVTLFLPGRWADYASAYLPGGEAGLMIMSTGTSPLALVSPWSGFGVLAAWTVVALLVAAGALTYRSAPEPRTALQ